MNNGYYRPQNTHRSKQTEIIRWKIKSYSTPILLFFFFSDAHGPEGGQLFITENL